MSNIITDHPLLPESETRELLRAYQENHDMTAAERLIAHNERFIYRMANFYYTTGACGDQEIEDLMQWGRMGMLKAMKDFNLSAGTKFITYAYEWVRLYIGRYGKRDGQAVSMSYQANRRKAAVGKAQATFIQHHHRNPTSEELAELTGFSPKKVSSLCVRVESLDKTLFENDSTDDTTLGERLPDPDADTAGEAENSAMITQVMEKLERLPHRDQQVIILLFGLGGIEPQSLRQVANKFKVSPERVRQIKFSALLWLRETSLFDKRGY
jgi:RNA polymerase primary sigma factor